MFNYKDFFQGKKVTVMGLGLLGGALNDVKFLLDCGADLIITDMKTEAELWPSIKKLQRFKGPGKYELHLGGHRLEDFNNKDYILQPGNVPPDSPYLLEAKKNHIPIHESESLFFEYLPQGVITIGVTGTRGKTTTTHLIYKTLKSALSKKVYLAGNVQGLSTLALLKKVKPGNIVVLELDSWCLHGIGEVKKSPHISVFTNLLSDHLNFYLKDSRDEKEAESKYFYDKANIYLYQSKNDFLVCGKEIAKRIGKTKSKKIIVDSSLVPKNWKLKIAGEHNLKNVACAIKACEATGLPLRAIKKGVESFSGVEGRLQLLREYKGIKIYNDTTATTPDATIAALKSFKEGKKIKKKRIVLLFGGADKNLDMSQLMAEIPNYCKKVVLISGSGTEKLKKNFVSQTKDILEFNNFKRAVDQSLNFCIKGDIFLFSPAFASFGMFKNEFDRGDQFVKIIKKLK